MRQLQHSCLNARLGAPVKALVTTNWLQLNGQSCRNGGMHSCGVVISSGVLGAGD